MASLQTIYSDPPTFMGMLVECSQFIDRMRHDVGASKEDVLDSVERRVSLLVGKLASQPTSAAFSLDPPPPQAS